jgi:anti-sigma factor RsiW
MNEFDDEYGDWDAAYVLGALGHEERKEYEAHLAKCTPCSNSVTLLAGIPGFLGKIDSNDAINLMGGATPTPAVDRWDDSIFIQKLAKRAAQAQRTSRIRNCASIGLASSVLVHQKSTVQSPSTQTASASWSLTNLQPQVMSAALRITSKSWGTHFDWSCAYSKVAASWPATTRYNLVLTDSSGKKFIVASWSPSGAIAKGLSATTALSVNQIKKVEVTVSGSPTPIIVGVKA